MALRFLAFSINRSELLRTRFRSERHERRSDGEMTKMNVWSACFGENA